MTKILATVYAALKGYRIKVISNRRLAVKLITINEPKNRTILNYIVKRFASSDA